MNSLFIKVNELRIFSKLQKLRNYTIIHIESIIIGVLFAMFVLGYTESLRWPLPIPKATHGLLKGLMVVLFICIPFSHKFLTKVNHQTKNILTSVFVLVNLVSALFTVATDTAILYLWYPFIVLAITYYFSRVIIRPKHFHIFIFISMTLVFLTFAFAFFSLMFRYSVDNLYYTLFITSRANHLLDELKFVGKYVSLGPYIMLTPVCMYFLISSQPIWRKILSMFIYVLSVMTAVISNNRIDVAVIAFQSFVFLFLIPRKYIIIMVLIAIPVIQFGLYTTQTYFGYNVAQRLFEPKKERDQESANMRWVYWGTALYNFRNSPIFGIGPNAYNDLSDFPTRKYFNEGPNGGYTLHRDLGIGVHNLFIERLSDTGLLGLSVFIAILFYFFRRDVLKVLQKENTKRSMYILFSLGSWTWILYGITDNGYGAQGLVTFFVLRGMVDQI